MPAIHLKCNTCNARVRVDQETALGRKLIRRLSCGHTDIFVPLESKADLCDEIISEDGKKLFPYQTEAVRFAESANIRAIIADKFGLGKTVEALALMKLHPECRPFLVVAKSTILVQWAREIKRWVRTLPIIINDSKEFLDGFDAYVISYDRFRRIKDLEAFTKQLGLRTIILDECQQIKNTESQRTAGVRKVVEKVPFFLALSGAPIENNAKEYFPVLNMVSPEQFPTEAGFLRNHLDFFFDGYRYTTGGLRNPARFKSIVSKFIIRRSPEEVLSQFPVVKRGYRYSDLGGQVEKEYLAELEGFNSDMNEGSGWSFDKYSNVLARLGKMRHITGKAKIAPCADFVQEYFENPDNKKLVIFTHHLDVADILCMKISDVIGEKPLHLSASLNMEQRDRMTQQFINNGDKVLVASTLASGEGLDGLQKVCKDMIVLERQWNPKKEENAEARLARLGQSEQHINATYLVALGTVDEFFAELVEKKREVVGSVLESRELRDWNESSLIKELAEILLQKGGKKWQL